MKSPFLVYSLSFIFGFLNLAYSQQTSCYLTSTIVYGYTGPSFSLDATLSVNQTTSAISPPTTGSSTTKAPLNLPSTISNSLGPESIITFLGSSAEQSLASVKLLELSGVPGIGSTSSITSTAGPVEPLSTTSSNTSASGSKSSAGRFYISVNVYSSSLRLGRRTVEYVAFSGDDGVLVDTQGGAALFELVNGYLISDGEFVGANISTGTSAFHKSNEPSAGSQGWSSDGGSIGFGNATFCVAIDGAFYIVVTSPPSFPCREVAPAVVLAPSASATSENLTILEQSNSSPTLSSSEIGVPTTSASATPTTAIMEPPTTSPVVLESSTTPIVTESSTATAGGKPATSGVSSLESVIPVSNILQSSAIQTMSQKLRNNSEATSQWSSLIVHTSSTSTSAVAATLSPTSILQYSTAVLLTSATKPLSAPSVPHTSSANVLISASPSFVTHPSTTIAFSMTTTPAVPQVGSLVNFTTSSAAVPSNSSVNPPNSLVTFQITTATASHAVSSISTTGVTQPSISDATNIQVSSTNNSTPLSMLTTMLSSITSAAAATTSAVQTTTITTIVTSTSTTIASSTLYIAPGVPVPNTGKRGLAYTQVSYTQFYSLNGDNSQVSWAYDYYSLPNSSNNVGNTNPALTFVPLLFNSASGSTSQWAANVNTSIAKYKTDSALSFNEPDGCPAGESACMTIAASVAGYQTYMNPLAGRVLLGAPAVTNTGPPTGLTYLSYFLGNCTGCVIDFIPIHWYASPYNFQYLTQYVEQAYLVGGQRPIWITEMGMDNQNYADKAVQAFMKNATTWLDAQPYVHRYAWFGDFTGYLLNTAGTVLSAQGVIWNNYTGGYVYSFN